MNPLSTASPDNMPLFCCALKCAHYRHLTVKYSSATNTLDMVHVHSVTCHHCQSTQLSEYHLGSQVEVTSTVEEEEDEYIR